MISKEEDLSFRTYSPVLNYRYDRWFQNVEYNGRTLNEEERHSRYGLRQGGLNKKSAAIAALYFISFF